MEWNWAYTNIDRMEQALRDKGCEQENGKWEKILVARPLPNINDFWYFTASYYPTKRGVGTWISEVMVHYPNSVATVRSTDFWTVLDRPVCMKRSYREEEE